MNTHKYKTAYFGSISHEQTVVDVHDTSDFYNSIEDGDVCFLALISSTNPSATPPVVSPENGPAGLNIEDIPVEY